jgi:hypothetical protein
MNKTEITGHMLVKNEDRFIWYAISSVIEYLDQLIIFDTGSTDKTIEIIKSFKNSKIKFYSKGPADSFRITDLRNEQLAMTKSPWFMLVDGDEVWPRISLESAIEEINNATKEKIAVVNKTVICLGDIQHKQSENAGMYRIGKLKGHYNIRFYRKVPGFRWFGEYPQEAYRNSTGRPVQELTDNLIISPFSYWHLTHLPRSTSIKNPKIKLELGQKINKTDLPEAFFLRTPPIVPSVWLGYSLADFLVACFITPLKKLKRLFQ